METLVFVDRLLFEAIPEPAASEESQQELRWSTPEDHWREMLSQIAHPASSGATQFLFISRLSLEQMEIASTKAYAQSLRNAEVMARAIGKKLSDAHYFGYTIGGVEIFNPERHMERQRCAGLLAETSYALSENEIASEDPRSVDFKVTVNAHYYLE